MPKVFLVNEPRVNSRTGEPFDLSEAANYGEVIVVFDKKSWPKPSKDTSKAVEHASRILDAIEPEDFILYAGGDAIALAIVSVIADKFLDGETKFLRWDRDKDADTGCYRVIKVENQ